MTLRARVSRLDDYSGDLTKSLEKLEIERSRGALDRDQQADFLADLRAAMELRDLKPVRTRARLDLLLAISTLVVLLTVPHRLFLSHIPLMALAALCLLGFGLAVWRYTIYTSRRRHDLGWLAKLEARAAAGGTIFDEV